MQIVFKNIAVEILGVATFLGWAIGSFIFGYLLKIILDFLACGKNEGHWKRYYDPVYRKHEYAWSYWVAWWLAHVLFGILATLIWIEIYETYHDVAASPYIFTSLGLYLFSVFGWSFCVYIYRTWIRTAYFCVLGSIIWAIISPVLILVLLEDHPWYHYLSLLLWIPSFLAAYNTYYVIHYRHHILHHSHHHKKHVTIATQQSPKVLNEEYHKQQHDMPIQNENQNQTNDDWSFVPPNSTGNPTQLY